MYEEKQIVTRNNTQLIPQGVIKEILVRILHRFSIEYDGQTERLNLNYNHGSGKLIQVKVSRNH